MRLATTLRDAPRSALLVALAAVLAIAGLASGSDLAGAAARAVAVVALLGAGVAVLRARRGAPTGPRALLVVERHALSRDCGVAVVAAGRRQLVVGFGAHGVQLVAELASCEPGEEP